MNDQHYQLLTRTQEAQLSFLIYFEDGSIRKLQYMNLYAAEFSADGTKLTLIFSGGAPMVTFHGENLHQLADPLQSHYIAAFFHYVAEDWKKPPSDNAPVILHVVEDKKEEN